MPIEAEKDISHYDEVREEQIEEFVEFLESKEEITKIKNRGNIDFTFGSWDVWPEYHEDDHIRAVRSSSIDTHNYGVEDMKEENFVNAATMHLPPAKEDLKEEIIDYTDRRPDSWEIHDDLLLHFGTKMLGEYTPPPDGIITPHVESVDKMTFDQVKECVETLVGVYREVYNNGEKAIKVHPND